MNEEQIAAYLRAQMPDARDVAVSNVARIPGGASRETWMFDARWSQATAAAAVERAFILRRDPPASLLESNNDLEFELYTALAESGIPVPARALARTRRRGARAALLHHGAPARRDRRAHARHCRRSGRSCGPQITRQKAEILAKIHAFDIDAAARARPAARRPKRAALHEVERWERTMRADTLEPQPVLEMALSWLKRHVPPPPERLALVHADYRTGNFLYDQTRHHGHPRLGDGARGRPDRGRRLGVHQVVALGRRRPRRRPLLAR